MPLWTGDPEFKQYVRMGEIAFARMRGDEAKARMRAHPGQFWRCGRWIGFCFSGMGRRTL